MESPAIEFNWCKAMKTILKNVVLPLIAVFCIRASAQTVSIPPEANAFPVSLTGLVLLSDWRCDEFRVKVQSEREMPCPDGAVAWKLYAGTELYPLQVAASLKQFETSRVTITGNLVGKRLILDKVTPTETKEDEVQTLVEQLRVYRWYGPRNYTSPTHWFFRFTSPMLQILQTGSPAQGMLLKHLDDHDIKDQIIVLLGGVGDEKAIEPIIRAMVDSTEHSPAEKKINLLASLALTNITRAEVIWHRGGGISIDRCPDAPKSCWYAWWIQNRETFKVADVKGTGNYSNYPNYGIYQQP
jgi:hypothetical protein